KLFAILLIFVALRMILMPQFHEREALHLTTLLQNMEPLLIGLLAGLMAGFFGVGGGIIFVPAGVLLAGLPQVIAQGSSFTAMLPTSLAGSLTYWKKRSIEWQLLKWIIPGAWIGTYAGSYAADLIPGRILQIIFSLFLIYSGVRKLLAKPHERLQK
ncbi:MAG: sulfite exporter TauE/SafE family protein, partial [bacterium]|nr:sulfite exporter TauE/SafE family protein [bacterium]